MGHSNSQEVIGVIRLRCNRAKRAGAASAANSYHPMAHSCSGVGIGAGKCVGLRKAWVHHRVHPCSLQPLASSLPFPHFLTPVPYPRQVHLASEGGAGAGGKGVKAAVAPKTPPAAAKKGPAAAGAAGVTLDEEGAMRMIQVRMPGYFLVGTESGFDRVSYSCGKVVHKRQHQAESL